MKWIHTVMEFYTCIDDEDYETVSQYIWRNSKLYAKCFEMNDLFLHEFLMGSPPAGFHIDHINRCPWDNRRSNLRIVSISENTKNRGLPINPLTPSELEKEAAKEQRLLIKYSEKHVRIRSEKKRGFHKHQKNIHAKKKVVDDLGNVFDSVSDASLFYGLRSSSGISMCLSGSKKTAKGRVWKYAQ